MTEQDKHAVKVVDGHYVFEGTFHKGAPGVPIYDPEMVLQGITKPRMVVHVHSYGGEAPFFQNVSENGRLLATRCDTEGCPGKGHIWTPFRIFCPDCLKKMTVLDRTDEAMEGATVYTFIKTSRSGAFNLLDKPIRFVDIQIPGSVTLLKSYMLGDVDPEIGLPIVPIFRTDPNLRTYTILDLAWVAKGTLEKDLPKGFQFGGPAKG